MTVVQGTINCASLLAGSRSKEEMGGIARARDKDIILKSIAFVCRGDFSASLLLTNVRRQSFAIVNTRLVPKFNKCYGICQALHCIALPFLDSILLE